MSLYPQIDLLKNLINQSRLGNEAAIKAIRTICTKAVEKSPQADLILLAELLVKIHDSEVAEWAKRN